MALWINFHLFVAIFSRDRLIGLPLEIEDGVVMQRHLELPYHVEKSIFHTHEPRDGRTGVHLMVVVACFISALAVTIIFAEMNSYTRPTTLLPKSVSKKSLSVIFGENFFSVSHKIFGNIQHVDENFARNGAKISSKSASKDTL